MQFCIIREFSDKNYGMAKALDYISATVIILILTFVWSTLAFKNWIVSLIFSMTLTAITVFTVRKFSHSQQKPYTYERLETEFCIQGNGYVIELLKSCLKNAEIENGCNYILLKNSILIANYKFSTLGLSDICTVCNLAAAHNTNTVYLLSKGIDRRAYQIAQLKNTRIYPVKTKAVFKFLQKHNALPDLKPIKRKFSFPSFFRIAFSRANFKSYAFSGIVLILTSFLTPLRVYYIVFGTISLCLALVCLTPAGNGSVFAPKAFDELEKQLETEYTRQTSATEQDAEQDEKHCSNSDALCDNQTDAYETKDGDDK